MGELANEVHVKKCMQCGERITQPVLYKGYVFCSIGCKETFLKSHPKL